jgi:hypothetical protein
MLSSEVDFGLIWGFGAGTKGKTDWPESAPFLYGTGYEIWALSTPTGVSPMFA